MRRRVRQGAAPEDGLFHFVDYPFDDEEAIAAVNARLDRWCEENGVDAISVIIEAGARGLLDQPWDPYEEWGLPR